MTRSRLRWALFTACAALVVAAMAWTTNRVVSLESARLRAERDAAAQARIRVALWRMDSALAPLLAQEAALPWQRVDANRSGFSVQFLETALDPRFGDDRVRLRFALHDVTEFDRGLRPIDAKAADSFAAGFRAMDRIASRTPPGADDDAGLTALHAFGAVGLAARVHRDAPAVQQAIAAANGGWPWRQTAGPMPTDPAVLGPLFDNRADRQQRARSAQNYQVLAGQNGVQQEAEQSDAGPAAGAAPTDSAKPYVPVWLDAQHRWLAYVREPMTLVEQGFVLDWDRVRAGLLAEVADLFPGASLDPVAETAIAQDETGLVLTTAPARLVVPSPPADAGPAWTPTRVGLAVAWLAVLGALGAAALTLRATVADADRRARFASSVTHELRTPLTTFRLYSEMLADGMVTDDATRAEYLRTLKSESARLATLVENVLAYARVEDGRAPRQRERIAVRDLVERAAPPLRRCADEAGMRLVVRVDEDAAGVVVEANADAVLQVLQNLVDNACKYAASATDRTIEVTVERAGGGGAGGAASAGTVSFRVRDHGPGLAPENVAAAFTPFERGNRPPGDAVPGIGLGLALSRGLARDHGGDLAYAAPADGPGAAFVLTLPAAPSPGRS